MNISINFQGFSKKNASFREEFIIKEIAAQNNNGNFIVHFLFRLPHHWAQIDTQNRKQLFTCQNLINHQWETGVFNYDNVEEICNNLALLFNSIGKIIILKGPLQEFLYKKYLKKCTLPFNNMENIMPSFNEIKKTSTTTSTNSCRGRIHVDLLAKYYAQKYNY
jgi:hypothetical protein